MTKKFDVTLQVYDTHGTLVRMILDGEEFERDVISLDSSKTLKDGTHKVIEYATKKFADDIQHLQFDHGYDDVPQEFYVDNFILGYLVSGSYTIDKDVLYIPIDEDSIIINVHINLDPLDKIYD